MRSHTVFVWRRKFIPPRLLRKLDGALEGAEAIAGFPGSQREPTVLLDAGDTLAVVRGERYVVASRRETPACSSRISSEHPYISYRCGGETKKLEGAVYTLFYSSRLPRYRVNHIAIPSVYFLEGYFLPVPATSQFCSWSSKPTLSTFYTSVFGSPEFCVLLRVAGGKIRRVLETLEIEADRICFGAPKLPIRMPSPLKVYGSLLLIERGKKLEAVLPNSTILLSAGKTRRSESPLTLTNRAVKSLLKEAEGFLEKLGECLNLKSLDKLEIGFWDHSTPTLFCRAVLDGEEWEKSWRTPQEPNTAIPTIHRLWRSSEKSRERRMETACLRALAVLLFPVNHL